MSTWKAVITEKGEALLAKLTMGSTMEITHAEIGAGSVDALLLKQQTSVSNVKGRASIEPVGYPAEGMCALPVTITSKGVTANYAAWQIGVFANDPDEGQVLFFIAQAEDTATNVPSDTLNPSYSTQIVFYVEYGAADSVNITVDPANVVTYAGLENYIANHVTPESIGLGNVNNTADNDKYVAFATRAGTADKAKYGLTLRVNGGRTEGTDQWTYDGSVSKVVNITPEKIGAAEDDHVHSLADLHNVPGTPQRADMHYDNLAGTGLVSASATTAEVVAAMPTYSQFTWSHTTNTSVYLTDAPCTYGVCVLIKGYGENYIHGWFLGYDGEIYRYKYHATNKTKNGWTKVLTNVLSPDDYGTELPAPGTPGRIFFKKVSS